MPQTLDGARLWGLVQALRGQVRVGGTVALGWDMTAALALGRAMGLPGWLIAEVLPEVEAIVMAKLNDGGESDG